MAFLNMFRRTNMVIRRQQKAGAYAARAEKQQAALIQLQANHSQLTKIAQDIEDTRKHIRQSHHQYADLRKTFANKYTQYKKNARRVLGNNRSLIGKLSGTAQKIFATHKKNMKNMNNQNKALHTSTLKFLSHKQAGEPARVNIPPAKMVYNAARGKFNNGKKSSNNGNAVRGVAPTNSVVLTRSSNK